MQEIVLLSLTVHHTGGEGGDFVREGFCPAPNTDITRSCPASQIFVPEFLVSPPTRPN